LPEEKYLVTGQCFSLPPPPPQELTKAEFYICWYDFIVYLYVKNKRVNKHTKDNTINANSRENMFKRNLSLDYYYVPWPFLSHCPLYIMPNSGFMHFYEIYHWRLHEDKINFHFQ
jgi:hypothetical protein